MRAEHESEEESREGEQDFVEESPIARQVRSQGMTLTKKEVNSGAATGNSTDNAVVANDEKKDFCRAAIVGIASRSMAIP